MLGALFGTTASRNTRTELIVFITPRVIRNPEDARDVSEELRSRLNSLRPAGSSSVVAAPYVPAPGQRVPVAQPQVLVPQRPRRALKAWRPSRPGSGWPTCPS